MDLDSIEAGLDFAEVIREAVDSCAVLVALFGRQWETLTDEAGRRRLDNPDDYVRFEVQTSLERGVRVIPVLVDGAKPLRQQMLPPGLQKLARLNAFELSYGRYQYDADRLVNLIQQILAGSHNLTDIEREAAEDAERETSSDVERKAGEKAAGQASEEAELAILEGRAQSVSEMGDAAGARDQYAALLPVSERVHGLEHRDTLVVRANLANWTGEAGDAAGARDQFAALGPVPERILGPEHQGTLVTRSNLAHWTGKAGDGSCLTFLTA